MSVQPSPRAKARIKDQIARDTASAKVEAVRRRVASILEGARQKWEEVPADLVDGVKAACQRAATVADFRAREYFKWEKSENGGIALIALKTLVAPVAQKLFDELVSGGYCELPKPEDLTGITLRQWVETVKAVQSLVIQYSEGERLYNWNADWRDADCDLFYVESADAKAA